jgi:hypothetical protein
MQMSRRPSSSAAERVHDAGQAAERLAEHQPAPPHVQGGVGTHAAPLVRLTAAAKSARYPEAAPCPPAQIGTEQLRSQHHGGPA